MSRAQSKTLSVKATPQRTRGAVERQPEPPLQPIQSRSSTSEVGREMQYLAEDLRALYNQITDLRATLDEGGALMSVAYEDEVQAEMVDPSSELARRVRAMKSEVQSVMAVVRDINERLAV